MHAVSRVFFACALLTSAAELLQGGEVDSSTMHHKVMVGYQGWFRALGDGTEDGWRHWSRNTRQITPRSVTFEMWPDMSEYAADEQFAAGDFSYAGGAPATLFSSAHPRTVERHFAWMQQHEIDGVFLQRFLVEAGRPSSDRVLANVRAAAAKTGRAYALCYDLSGARKETMVAHLLKDWRKLVDEQKVTSDKQYLHHRGKPVLFVWGFYSDRFEAKIAHELIDTLKANDAYSVTLVGGCQWQWREEQDAEWAKAFRRLDVISPWNVGNVTVVDKQKHAATDYWQRDLEEARRAGKEYLPVIYPGFGWTNLKGESAARNTLPRLRGEFFWRQFHIAKDLGIEMAYVAMFDEVDEATAIFKVTNSPPTQKTFATYEGLPSDWYLRLTGEGTKLLRGDRENSQHIPIRP